MTIKKFSVIIPVYGQWNLVKRNVDSILSFDRNSFYEIILVDDCSPEPNPYNFDKDLVKILRNEFNLGYSGTVNRGLKKAKSDVILLLDSDAFLIEPVVSNILKMYDLDNNIGCIGFKTVDNLGFRTGSYCYEPLTIGLILGQFLESKIEKLYFLKKRNIMPYSCSVSFRKNCLEEIGYLDEKLFPVLDADIDIAMRIHTSRWKLIMNEDISICHSGGNSYKINYKRVLLHYQSRWQLLLKHKLLKYPKISKFFIISRLSIEYLIFFIIHIINRKTIVKEKQDGRLLIIKEVKAF